MSVFSAALLIFLVLDPLGNIPMFMSVLSGVDRRRHRFIIVREMLIALSVLVLFLFAGSHILNLLGVSQSSLGMAGGIILLMIAVKMVFAGSESIFETAAFKDPFIVPLAVPLIAGPSAIATVILIMAREPSRWAEWLGAVLCAWLASCLVLLLSGRLCEWMGARALKAFERLVGMVLTAVAVEMFITGLRQAFPM